MGARLLRNWLLKPTRSLIEIRKRQELVGVMVKSPIARMTLRKELRSIFDMERLASRIGNGIASPRDVQCLARSVLSVRQLGSLLRSLEFSMDVVDSPIASLRDSLIDRRLIQVAEEVVESLVDPAPSTFPKLGVGDSYSRVIIRKGFDEELDRLRGGEAERKLEIQRYEAMKRKDLGLPSLKVVHVQHLGHVVRLPRVSVDQMSDLKLPPSFTRVASTKAEVRFRCKELAELQHQWDQMDGL
eukprot:CAMPEP_0184678252 /NCGR_PEP_ID=MMETSP0312-20130426/973_1 /TAXON_ID=31354 /ORGANISM="Compsopogon coeruleus, Strain SAG 36.94" /LENGTH=242 /DNA_ID=CAMNT_0027126845 /DNA_START=65 /DNA_END=789 /DNA_ORIENTATION=-